MVRTVHVTGIASARTTEISLGAYLGRGRVAVLTAVRQLNYGSQALSIHPHRHTFSAHAHRHTFSAHPHRHTFSAHAIAIGSAAYNTNLALMVSAGALEASDVTGGTGALFPAQVGTVHLSNVAGTIHHSNVAGTIHLSNVTGLRHGATATAYTVDSRGMYVLEAEHPAANHANLQPHGGAGPRIELGNVIRNNDILEITVLMTGETTGVFY